jgi:hypothetical protein
MSFHADIPQLRPDNGVVDLGCRCQTEVGTALATPYVIQGKNGLTCGWSDHMAKEREGFTPFPLLLFGGR